MAYGMSNPYLPEQAAAITDRITKNFNQNIMPGMRSNSAASGFGGSRQAITQGLAMGNTNDSIAQALAGLYGNAYESDANRAQQSAMQQASLGNALEIARMGDATQRLGLQNQYTLGMGNLGLGQYGADTSRMLGLMGAGTNQFQADTSRMGTMGNLGIGQYNAETGRMGQNQNFYTQQRGQDMQQAQLGASMFGQGMTGLGQQGAGLYNAGRNAFDAGILPYQTYGQLLSPFTGYNTSTTTSPGPSRVGGLLGGLLGGMQLGSIWGG